MAPLMIKVSVLSLLAVLFAAAVADARVDLYETSNSDSQSDAGWQKFCSTCECKREAEGTKCYRTDFKEETCPVICGSSCICNFKYPSTCICTYEVDTCNPEKCNSFNNDMLRPENLLVLNKI